MSQEAVPGNAPAVEPGKTVQLPCGYLTKDGTIIREAEIVAMTGLTRKSIAREDIRSNSAKVTDVILLQCLKRIGSVALINNKIINELILGDRDFLLLEIRRLSLGDKITANTECGGCKKKLDVVFSVNDIPVTGLKDGSFEIRDGVRVFRIQNEVPHVDAVLRFPRGEDQQVYLPTISKNPIEANFKLYAACMVEWDGKPGPFRPDFFERLPVNVLDVLDGGFSENQPGPDLRQNVSCPECAADIELTFEGSDFLFRPRKRGTMS